jgi:hypothetical protein
MKTKKILMSLLMTIVEIAIMYFILKFIPINISLITDISSIGIIIVCLCSFLMSWLISYILSISFKELKRDNIISFIVILLMSSISIIVSASIIAFVLN